MRISPEALLVLIAITIPFLVQLRTVLFYIGFEPTVAQSVGSGIVVIGAIVLWAFLPEISLLKRTNSNGG